jgi:multidrug efflux pump subunit AcrA (membrane-fusion protein)
MNERPGAVGQVIVRLIGDQLPRQREQSLAALTSAQAQLAQAETAVKRQRETLAADGAARRRSASCRGAPGRVATGARPQEIQVPKPS